MGLYCNIDLHKSLGLPLGGEEIAIESGYVGEMFTPDYTPGAQAFAAGFMQSIASTCPYLTGYLFSTIAGDAYGFEINVWADAEYAQYLEYGTWKMAAQPYFEISILAGIRKAAPIWRKAVQKAYKTSQRYIHLEEQADNADDPMLIAELEAQMMELEMEWAQFEDGIEDFDFGSEGGESSEAAISNLGDTEMALEIGASVGQYAMVSVWGSTGSQLLGLGAGMAAGGATFLFLAPLSEAFSGADYSPPSRGEQYGFDLAEHVAQYAMASAWANTGSQFVGTLTGMAVGAFLGPLFATLFDALMGGDYSKDGGVLSDNLDSFIPNIEIT